MVIYKILCRDPYSLIWKVTGPSYSKGEQGEEGDTDKAGWQEIPEPREGKGEHNVALNNY